MNQGRKRHADADTIPATGTSTLDGIECVSCRRQQVGVPVHITRGLCVDCLSTNLVRTP